MLNKKKQILHEIQKGKDLHEVVLVEDKEERKEDNENGKD